MWQNAKAELENDYFCGMSHKIFISRSQNLIFHSRGKVKLRILEDLLEPNTTTNTTSKTLYVSAVSQPVELFILSENKTILS